MDKYKRFPILIKWYDHSLHGKISWFFRGIREDGSFYGDVKTLKLHNNIEVKPRSARESEFFDFRIELESGPESFHDREWVSIDLVDE